MVLFRVLRMRLKAKNSPYSPSRMLEVVRGIQHHQVTLHRKQSAEGLTTLTPEQKDYSIQSICQNPQKSRCSDNFEHSYHSNTITCAKKCRTREYCFCVRPLAFQAATRCSHSTLLDAEGTHSTLPHFWLLRVKSQRASRKQKTTGAFTGRIR